MSEPPVVRLLTGACQGCTYELLREIGAGTFGKVHRARRIPQPAANTEQAATYVAIKFIPLYGGARYLEMIKREVTLSNQLNHPHVLRIHDYVVDPDFRFDPPLPAPPSMGAIGLVMDLAKCSLDPYINSCRNMGEDAIRWLFQQIVIAVDHCHGKLSV